MMTELSTTKGPSSVSYDTVRSWKNKFESGVESIKNAPKSGMPKFASRKEIVSKIKEIIEGMPDLQFVKLHEKEAYHYKRFTLF